MRSIAILAAGALAVLPLTAATAQSTSTSTTLSKPDLHTMWEKIKGSWTQTKGAVKEQWGKLTDDDLDQIEGNTEKLAGKLQERYGYAQDRAKQEIDEWTRRYEPVNP